MASQPFPFLNAEQYLEIERAAEYKSEYWKGEMFAMAGATRPHNLIAGNTFGQIRGQLRGKPCETYTSDMRVLAAKIGFYAYPDVVILCGSPQFPEHRQDTLLNPTVVIEVLSPTTEAYDRGRKFERYRTIDSLRQYLLLAQDRAQADLFTRRAEGPWVLTSCSGREDFVDLESVGCRLSLAECYERVEFTD